MATTTVSDAIVVPQAKGTGLSSEDDPVDAVAVALMSQYAGGEYVVGDYANGLAFTGHDGTNDTVTIDTGACFVQDTSTSTGGSRGSGGNAQLQSTSTSGYDTEIPDNQAYLVIFPSTVTVSLSSATLNQVWINVTSITGNNQVEVRSDGGGGTTATPSDTYIKLGDANPDDNTADVRANDYASVTRKSVNVQNTLNDSAGNVMLDNVVATGSVTLSSGAATIDTGVATTETATFMVALGPSTDDADVAADVRSDSTSTNYEVDVQETDTSVGNPSVEYDIIRVR